MINYLMLLSTIPIFLLIADGYYQKDLKKGIVLFILCVLFVFGGAILAQVFKFRLIYVGIPIITFLIIVSRFFKPNK